MEIKRYILVTGAGSGIGRALCSRLLDDRLNVVIALSKNTKHLSSLKEACQEKPGLIYSMPFDLVSGNYDELASEIQKITNCIDVLVNNAGVLVQSAFQETPISEWKAVYEVNLFSVVHLIQALLPTMENHEKIAHIVNISSMGGVQGSIKFPGLSAYSTSKAALIGLTEVLAVEFMGKNIHVNCVALGSVQTEMFNKAFPGMKAGASKEDIAEMLAEFCIKSSAVFNGKLISVSISTP